MLNFHSSGLVRCSCKPVHHASKLAGKPAVCLHAHISKHTVDLVCLLCIMSSMFTQTLAIERLAHPSACQGKHKPALVAAADECFQGLLGAHMRCTSLIAHSRSLKSC